MCMHESVRVSFYPLVIKSVRLGDDIFVFFFKCVREYIGENVCGSISFERVSMFLCMNI